MARYRGKPVVRLLLAISLASSLLTATRSSAQQIPVPVPRPEMTEPAGDTELPAASVEAPPPIYQTACPALRSGLVTGRMAPPVDDNGCLARSPVAVTALANGAYALRHEALLSCAMAGTLAQFAERADATARQVMGAGLAAIDAGPGYQCRRRNGAATGKLSEHAFANALDITGFVLADGRELTIAQHWPRAVDSRNDAQLSRGTDDAGRFLAVIHEEACKLFTTVLGPDSNTAHESHFHFDLGCHGRNCDYYICE